LTAGLLSTDSLSIMTSGGNIAEYNSNATSSTSPSKTSYIWGYNGLFPVAEVKNASEDLKTITTTTNGTGYGDVYPPANGTGTDTGTFTAAAGGSIPISLAFSGTMDRGRIVPLWFARSVVQQVQEQAITVPGSALRLCWWIGLQQCSNKREYFNTCSRNIHVKCPYLFAPTLASGVTVFVAYSILPTTTTVTTTERMIFFMTALKKEMQ